MDARSKVPISGAIVSDIHREQFTATTAPDGSFRLAEASEIRLHPVLFPVHYVPVRRMEITAPDYEGKQVSIWPRSETEVILLHSRE